MKGIRKLLTLIKVILLVNFVIYFVSITFFTHIHVINGVTIVHSHPFAEDNEGKPLREHSGAEIQLIHTLSVFFSTTAIFVVIVLLAPTARRITVYIKKEYSFSNKKAEGFFRLRPPPFFIV